ncbi:DUF805 domain-containing protein [Alkalicoccus luteus]|uniref:DUF805 domain-containing protein n=1 Tax=Alkalicoccus luteus TaxID=1237094 RepID=UPI0040343D3C
MNWYLHVLKNYATFSGRARRKEYWMFFLVHLMILVGLAMMETLIGLPTVISSVYSLAVLIPSLAVGVRRLHDTNRSGFWILINILPFLGWIIFIVFMALESDSGSNRFGPNPLHEPEP